MGKRSFDAEAIETGAVGRVVIIGDSHVHAIKDALETRSPAHGTGKIVAQRLLKSKPLAAVDGSSRQGRLQRLVDCHIARASAMGHQMPEMEYCPLMLKGVSAKVTSEGGGFAVNVRATDDATIQEVVRRAQALAPSATAAK